MKILFTRQANEVRFKFAYRENPGNSFDTIAPVIKSPNNSDQLKNREKNGSLAESRTELSSLVDQVLASESPEHNENPDDPVNKIHKKTESQVAEEREEGRNALIAEALSQPTSNFLAQTEEEAKQLGGWEQFPS